MTKATFTIQTDPESRGLGAIWDGTPFNELGNFTVMSDGRGLAHDILEHQHGVEAIGPVRDELIALGAVWWVRGQFNDIVRQPNINTSYNHMASDLVYMAPSAVEWLPDLALTVAETKTLCQYIDEVPTEDINEILKEARHSIRAEYDDLAPVEVRTYLAAAGELMGLGYLTAKARSLDGDAFRVNGLFWDIAEALSPIIARADEYEQFELTWDHRRAVSVTEVYPYFCPQCDDECDPHDSPLCESCTEDIYNLDREEVIERLENEFCIACYDEESTDELRECLVENLS